MTGSSTHDFIPIVGSALAMISVVFALDRKSVRFRRNVLIGVILIVAISLVLYWNDPEAIAGGTLRIRKPPWAAYVALWVLKLKAMLASAGLILLNRLPESALRPLFYALIALAGAANILMASALAL
jgi:hypothetical protein